LIGVGWPQWVVAAVALQRLAELAYATRNTRRLLARGAVERGRAHYPALVLLHSAWLVALFVFADPSTTPVWPWLVVFSICQALRVWVLATLGPYWTTRIIVLPGAVPVARGPYRYLRHPNYLIVAVEIPALSLGCGAPGLALLFGLANAVVLAIRISAENKARASLVAGQGPCIHAAALDHGRGNAAARRPEGG
jgi:methyltransferase